MVDKRLLIRYKGFELEVTNTCGFCTPGGNRRLGPSAMAEARSLFTTKSRFSVETTEPQDNGITA